MPKAEEANCNQDKPGNKKKGRSRAWLWFVLYGILVLTGLSIGSYYFRNGADRAKFLTESVLSASILAVIIAQAIIYGQQRRIMQRQNDLSAVAQRAYFGMKAVGIVNPLDPNTIVISAVLFNGGQTPAWNVEPSFQVGFIEGPPQAFDWNAPANQISDAGLTSTFFPSGAEKRITLPEILSATKEMVAEFKNGKRNIYVDGEIRFTDHMGIKQIFAFGMLSTSRDNGQFRERYQYQRDANPN